VRRLEIEGSLHVSLDERSIEIVAEGSHVRAEIAAFEVRRPSFRLLASSLSLARRLSRSLERRGLTLTVTRDGKPLAELGSGVRGVGVARLFGLSRVRVFRR
jgi:hypothetical protein